MTTLSEIADHSPGLRLYFTPNYGWGWVAPGDCPQLAYDDIERLGVIELEVWATFEWEGEYRGVSGAIVTEGHLLHGYNFVLWSMGAGEIDPRDGKPHRWDLYFSRQPMRSDNVDFLNADEAGVGYGFPSLKRTC